MNTPQADLWDFIKSLSPSEKRYYKTHFASEDSQHTLLFDVLNEQLVFDNEAARLALKTSIAQFKVLKVQLYEQLTKSLIAQQAKRNVKSRIRLGLEEVDLLLEREQFKRATKKLKNLAKISQQFGLTLYQYEITERLHEIQYIEPDVIDKASSIHQQQLSLLQKILSQKQILSNIQLSLSSWTPFMPKRHRLIKELLERLYAMKAEYLDFSNIITWYQCVANCQELLGKEEVSLRIRQDILAVFLHQPKFQKELPFNYLQALRQAANPSLSLPDLKKVEEISFKAKKHIAVFPQYSPHYIYFLQAQLQAYYLHHKWDHIFEQVEQPCLDYIESYQLAHIKTAIHILVILVVTHLVMESYETAAALLTKVRQQKTSEKSLEYNVYLLELCLLWESHAYHSLYQKVLQLKARQKQWKSVGYSNVFNAHLEFFSDISRKPFLAEEKAAATLLKIGEMPFDPILSYYSLFNLERWLQSVATRRKWQDVL